MEIAGQIRDYVKDKPCKVYPAPLDARFPETGEADDTITTVVYTKGDEIKSGAVNGLAVSLDSVFVE